MSNRYFLAFLILFLSSVLFYSPITLYGFWSDNVFLIICAFISIMILWSSRMKIIARLLLAIGFLNLVAVVFSSLSLFYGILPVHFIPIGKLSDKNVYAYYLERGNTGITSGCYGEVQYHKRISWLPLLEQEIDTDECAQMDYDTYFSP